MNTVNLFFYYNSNKDTYDLTHLKRFLRKLDVNVVETSVSKYHEITPNIRYKYPIDHEYDARKITFVHSLIASCSKSDIGRLHQLLSLLDAYAKYYFMHLRIDHVK